MAGALPFDDFRNLLAKMPAGSLGRLEDIAAWLATWTGRAPPVVTKPLVAIFAGNHGVARHRVSPRPHGATARSVELLAAGGGAVNQICIAHDLGLKVFDLALDVPTGDISHEPALDEYGCAATMAFGMEAIAGGADLLCIGDLGVANSTVAAAILAALYGGAGIDWVGVGSGADAVMVSAKADIVDTAIAFHQAHLTDPMEILCRLGGREFAATAGAILAARMERIPVILDGFAATAAAAVLHQAHPGALDHCLFSHVTPEPGHRRALELLGVQPLLDLKLHHGEATGAALAAGLVKAAALCSSGMAAAL